MGETIEFPNQKERLIYLGKQSFMKEDYLKALSYFEKSYQFEQDIIVNQYLVQILVKLGHYEQAHDYVKEYEMTYRIEPELHSLYFDVLLKNKLFLYLKKWLNSLNNNESFLALLEKAEQYWTIVDSQEYIKHLDKCQNIVNESMSSQVLLARQFDYLTETDFIKLIDEGLLKHDQLSPLVKAQLVDELVQLNRSLEFEMSDVYQQIHRVNANDISRLSTSVNANPLYLSLKEHVSNNEPTQETLVLGVVRTHLGMCYPFFEEVNHQVDSWKEAYLLYFGLTDSLETLENPLVQKKHKQIKFLDNILMNTMTK